MPEVEEPVTCENCGLEYDEGELNSEGLCPECVAALEEEEEEEEEEEGEA